MVEVADHKGLPLPGYRPQSEHNLSLVIENKKSEEALLRLYDEYQQYPDIDKRWLSVARTHLEQSFMALNRSIMRPERITLPKDGA